MGKINSRYSEFVLIPHEGITPPVVGENYETQDGATVKVKFISTWNNADGAYDDELDELCENRWGMTFAALRSMWISRLPYVGNYWHFVQLKKI